MLLLQQMSNMYIKLILKEYNLSYRFNEINFLHVDDGRVLKALNTRAAETRNNVGQVIISDVQVLKFGELLQNDHTNTIKQTKFITFKSLVV